MLHLLINRDQQLPDDECITGLQKNLTVEFVFSNDIIRVHSTFLHILRDYLFLEGFMYQHYPHSNKVVIGIALSFIPFPDDREYVFKQLTTLRVEISSNPPVHQK